MLLRLSNNIPRIILSASSISAIELSSKIPLEHLEIFIQLVIGVITIYKLLKSKK